MSDDRPRLCDIAMEEATFGVCATSRDGQHHCALIGEHGRHRCGCGLWGSSARERAEAAELVAGEARGYDRAIANLLDSPRYMAWHKGTQETPFPAILTTRRQHQEIARYLESQRAQP